MAIADTFEGLRKLRRNQRYRLRLNAAPQDADWESVSILLPFDGVNNATETDDLSNNTHTMTFGGNCALDVAEVKYGTACAQSLGGAGDLVGTPNHASLNLGTEEFTMEFDLYPANLTGSQILVSKWHSATVAARSFLFYTVGQNLTILYQDAGSSTTHSLSTTGNLLTATTWQHVALVREGDTLSIYIDGTVSNIDGTAISVTDWRDGTVPFELLDATNSAAAPSNMRMDNFRLTKGVARYTGDFTPPTEAFPTS